MSLNGVGFQEMVKAKANFQEFQTTTNFQNDSNQFFQINQNWMPNSKYKIGAQNAFWKWGAKMKKVCSNTQVVYYWVNTQWMHAMKKDSIPSIR